MNQFLLALAIGLGAAMVASLYRVFRGPTVFDRLNGLGLIGTKAIVLMLVLGERSGRIAMFDDISLAYALISFIGSMALANYFEHTERGR